MRTEFRFKPMKLTSAEFVFVDKKECVEIVFHGDSVRVLAGGKEIYKADNTPRKYGGRPYKPCVSHCLIVYRHATGKKQGKDHVRVAKSLKPKLDLFKG